MKGLLLRIEVYLLQRFSVKLLDDFWLLRYDDKRLYIRLKYKTGRLYFFWYVTSLIHITLEMHSGSICQNAFFGRSE